MEEIYHLLSFNDDLANESANAYLAKGWKLVHVGTRLIEILDNGQAYYNTEYVLGGTKEQYEQMLIDDEKAEKEFYDEYDL